MSIVSLTSHATNIVALVSLESAVPDSANPIGCSGHQTNRYRIRFRIAMTAAPARKNQ